jgi:hypothetical protein
MNVDFKNRQIFPRILPPQIASGANIIWCEHRSSSPKRENRIHPLDGASSKERKQERKRRESSPSVVGWVLYGRWQRVFQNFKM